MIEYDMGQPEAAGAASAPIASIVIANWNGERWLRQLLPHLAAQRFRAFETIIVDNGSTDGSCDYLRREWPQVRLIMLPRNTGFAIASNVGIRESASKYVALLNNDTRPEPDWLGELVRAAESDPAVGMCAPLIFDADRTDRLDSAGLGVWWDGSSRQMNHGEAPSDTAVRECLIPSGCAALYRRELLDEVGLLDERFTCYCEDTDLGLRARFAGWQCLLAPAARVHHYYSQSGGRNLARKIFWVERNHYLVAIKNYPWFLVALLPFTSPSRLLRQVWGFLRGRAAGQEMRGTLSAAGAVRAMLAAYLSLPLLIPGALRYRWSKRPPRSLSPGERLRLIRRFHVDVAEIIFN